MELSCCCGDFERLRDDSLVLHIFTFLPNLLDLLRLRAVCKSWCFAVRSPHFLKLYKPSFPWCVFRVRTEVPHGRPLHDYKMNLRNHAELWIPGTTGENCEYAIPRKCGVPLGPEGSCFVGLCSSGGLVCGRLMERRFLFILSVGNPITNVWKTLPPAPVREKFHLSPSRTCIHMQTSPTSLTSTQTSCYKIVVLYRFTKPGADDSILVVGYDSRTGVWDIGPKLVPSTLAASPLVGDAIDYYSCPPLHTGYDAETKTWSCCSIQFENLHPEGDAGNEWEGWLPGWNRLFKYKGEYYLLAELELEYGLNEERCSLNLGISIWKLQQDLNSWLLMSRILWKHLGFPTIEHRDIVADHKVDVVENTVVVSSFYRRNTYGNFHRYAYNMVTKAWTPAYTHLSRLADFEGCYTFLPSFTAQP